MKRRISSAGMKKCRKFTALVNSVNTMLVVSTALTGHYCALNQKRNGSSLFVARALFLK
jgi:tRNA U34 2-thiouridine synthase MnmA/TrmU